MNNVESSIRLPADKGIETGLLLRRRDLGRTSIRLPADKGIETAAWRLTPSFNHIASIRLPADKGIETLQSLMNHLRRKAQHPTPRRQGD